MKLLHMCVHFQYQFLVKLKVMQYLHHKSILHYVHLTKIAILASIFIKLAKIACVQVLEFVESMNIAFL
jgi:hypothetical protein